jgi:hypothetical protein
MSEESQDPILEQEQGDAVEEQEEEPGEAEQTEITPTEDAKEPPRGRPRLNEEDKRDRRRKTQQAYYAKVRAKAAPPPEPPKPILKAPKPTPKPTPKRTSAPKRVLVPRVEYEPSSPRSNLISAYREARIQQVERRQAMYSSWLE